MRSDDAAVRGDQATTGRAAVAAELDVLRAIVRGDDPTTSERRLAEARGQLGLVRSSLDEITEGFGLSPFERSVLLLAAGPELIAATGDDISRLGVGPRITFGSALAALPEAHWSAITPAAPLRRWQLVTLTDPSSPTGSPLLAAERVVHHLAGAAYLDEEVAALATVLAELPWVPSEWEPALGRVVSAWRAGRTVLIDGAQRANVLGAIGSAAGRLGMVAMTMPASNLPGDPIERAALLHRLERESVLSGVAWLFDASERPSADASSCFAGLRGFDAPLALLGGDHTGATPDTVTVRIERLSMRVRRTAVEHALHRAGTTASQADIDSASGVFDLTLPDLDATAEHVSCGVSLWTACRERSRAALDGLATVVPARATWDDLVLPPSQTAQLHSLVASVRQRVRVLGEWGFADRLSRGAGSTALFAGPSGTGKTTAAEVIANALDLDLVHVDLSQVVSKYIGETEKQLRRLFDAAEDGGCVLLFDEADVLFGARSAVRDSHDRYANLEVGYLLQRMEQFRGLAILTTNARDALDPAFTRRLRTIVSFPYPDQSLRETMWSKAFPASTPTASIDAGRLATLDVPGGGIASIALTAAYLAADTTGEVGDDAVDTAARWELAKSGRAVLGRTR